jgi:hypothetical protein
MHYRTKTLLTNTILTTEELAALTGWSIAKIRQDYHRGKLDAVLKGNVLLFDQRDIRPGARQ